MSIEQEYDQRFYWGVNHPKALEDEDQSDQNGNLMYTASGLKSQWIAQVKDTAGKILAQTDWTVIRELERQVAIPANVVTKRAAVVAECNRLEAAIAGCATVEELIAVVTTQNWPYERP